MANAQTTILDLANHEVYVITARHEGRESGHLATWIMPGTLVPDRQRVVAVLSPLNATHDLIRASGRFALNLLTEGQHDLIPRFGLQTAREVDKLAGLALTRTSSGLPLLPGTCGWAECVIVDFMDGGDRIVYLADIGEHRLDPGRPPLHRREATALLSPEVGAALQLKRQRDGERDRTLMRRRPSG